VSARCIGILNTEILEVYMNKPVLKLLFAALAATLFQTAALAAGDGAALNGVTGFTHAPGTPDTSGPRAGTAWVEQALRGYAAGCASGDEVALSNALTLFAVIEYPTAVPGRFTSVSAFDAPRCWPSPSLATGGAESKLTVFPTSEPDVFFVQYARTVKHPGEAHSMQALALIQMSGGRIALIRDFADPASPAP
jgi:hypothetical protein